jgi:hypothetical protein
MMPSSAYASAVPAWAGRGAGFVAVGGAVLFRSPRRHIETACPRLLTKD